MLNRIWLVPFFPLIGFLVLSLGRKALSKNSAGIIGSATIAASFIVSLIAFFRLPETPVTDPRSGVSAPRQEAVRC